jgi:NAD(P)-dependent dehydrogenase (short-subunit alcohol dehydrogenase family)
MRHGPLAGHVAVMRPAGYGRIILVASTGGLHGDVGLSAHAASKGGLLAFGRSLAAEGAGKGVLTNTLLPYALTQMTGLWLLACSHWLGLVLVASPVYMTNMLVRHTGKRLLEKHMARSKGAAYAEYVRRTSGFIPWPPR